MRVFQGLGGGPIIPMAQAIMWEIFPLRQRGTAMAVWGVGIMMAPILGPTVGGWIADNWSWRWIFYINLPIGALGFLMVSAFLFDSPFVSKPRRVDAAGLVLMVLGFGFLQLGLDLGEKEDWFDSRLIITLFVMATCTLVGFVARELMTTDPVLDLTVFRDRNFAVGTTCIALVGLAFNSSMLLLALYTQKVMGYDAWTSGMVLAPGGVGNLLSLVVAGRLVARLDMRWMLAVGCLLNAWAAYSMSTLTLGMDYWTLAWPRFVQGLGVGFVFLPLNALALATVPREKMGNATAALNVVRNIGGSVGVALVSTLLARRSQEHHATLVSHVNVWDPETVGRLSAWADRFMTQGADTHTAQRRALAALSNEVNRQAQVLAFADDFWLLFVLFASGMLMLPLLRRVVMDPAPAAADRDDAVPGLPVE
jgi:DHA2 family multidrug resistance protein